MICEVCTNVLFHSNALLSNLASFGDSFLNQLLQHRLHNDFLISSSFISLMAFFCKVGAFSSPTYHHILLLSPRTHGFFSFVKIYVHIHTLIYILIIIMQLSEISQTEHTAVISIHVKNSTLQRIVAPYNSYMSRITTILKSSSIY